MAATPKPQQELRQSTANCYRQNLGCLCRLKGLESKIGPVLTEPDALFTSKKKNALSRQEGNDYPLKQKCNIKPHLKRKAISFSTDVCYLQ